MAAIGSPTTRGSQSSMANSKINKGATASMGPGLGATQTKVQAQAPTPYTYPGQTSTSTAVKQASSGPTMLGGPTGYMSSSGGSSSAGSQLSSALSGLLSGQGQSNQPAVSYNPGQLSIQAGENPAMAGLIGEQAQARAGLAAGSDQDAVLAMQRQRDAMSGLAKEFGENAAERGISGSGAAEKALQKGVLEPGMQAMGALNAGLASDARAKQQAALGQQAGMVGQQAQLTQAQQQFGLSSWQAQQQAQQAAAQLAAMQRNQGLSNLQGAVSLIGSLSNLYSGF